MQSKTKPKITFQQIVIIINNWNPEVDVKSVTELRNGYYNAAYNITLSNDMEVVLKIGPSENVDVLTYEKDIMKREVEVYNIIKDKSDVYVPEVYYSDFTKEIIQNDYFIMEKIEGEVLSNIEKDLPKRNKETIYLELFKYLAKINNIVMNEFGYCKDQSKPLNYKEIFIDMIRDVLNDGLRNKVEYKIDIDELLSLVKDKSSVLDNNYKPSLIHFDAWNGNVFVSKINNEYFFKTIIDTERSFNGHRIAEFVSLNIDVFDDKNKKYLKVYNKYSNESIKINSETRTIYLLHKIYLYLIMIVECSYRDISGSFSEQYNWASKELEKCIIKIKKL